MRKLLIALALPLIAAVAAAPAGAAAQRATFAGNCAVSGPIHPHAPINALPRLKARFSYHGLGTCTGTLDGRPIQARSARVDVNRGDVLFDSCFLGPDTGVMAPLEILIRKRRWAKFLLKLDMIRVATLGPFFLSGRDGGSAFGQAELRPPDPGGAVAECANPRGGITNAELDARFETHSQFVGFSYQLKRPKRPERR